MKTPPFNFRQYCTTKANLLSAAKVDLAELTKKLVNLEDLEASAACPDYEELEPAWESTAELAKQLDDLLATIEPMVTALDTEAKNLKEEEPLQLPDLNKIPPLL